MRYKGVKKADVKRVIRLGQKVWDKFPGDTETSGIFRNVYEHNNKEMSYIVTPCFIATFETDFPDFEHVNPIERFDRMTREAYDLECDCTCWLEGVSIPDLLADVKRVLAEHNEANRGKRVKSGPARYKISYEKDEKTTTITYNAEWLAAGLQLVPNGNLYVNTRKGEASVLSIRSDEYNTETTRFLLAAIMEKR